MQGDAALLIPLALRWFGAPPAGVRVACLSAARDHEDALRAVSGRAASARVLVEAEQQLSLAGGGLFRSIAASTGMHAAAQWYNPHTFGLNQVGWEVSLRVALRLALRMDGARMADEEAREIDDTISTFFSQAVQPRVEDHSTSVALFLVVAALFHFRRGASERELPDRVLRGHVWLRSLRVESDAQLARWAVLARAALYAPDDVESCQEHLRQLLEDAAAVELQYY